MKIEFTVNGKPKGKDRPRFNKITGQVYTPRPTGIYERAAALKYKAAAGGYRFCGNVTVLITAYFAVPKSFSKAKRESALSGKLTPGKKPDADNIIKIILDGLNKAAYDDDKQVISVSCKKRYGDRERVEVTVCGEGEE